MQPERNVLAADFSAWVLWAELSPSCLFRGLVHTSCLMFAVISGGATRKRGAGERGDKLTFLTHLCPGDQRGALWVPVPMFCLFGTERQPGTRYCSKHWRFGGEPGRGGHLLWS